MMRSKENEKALDWDVALARVDGDLQLLAELSAIFLQDCPRLLDAAKTSIQNADYTSLERTAHTLSGQFAFFGLHRARERALELEMTGRKKDSSHALKTFAEIEIEMVSILPEFESFTREEKI
jgi:HPt (histidine-containing phosphotransfer) domain-containing protein